MVVKRNERGGEEGRWRLWEGARGGARGVTGTTCPRVNSVSYHSVVAYPRKIMAFFEGVVLGPFTGDEGRAFFVFLRASHFRAIIFVPISKSQS